jgi:hypothetical protein
VDEKSLVVLAFDFLPPHHSTAASRHCNQTTHCTRTIPPIHLHSSQWQGTSTLQLRRPVFADSRHATGTAAHPRLSAHSAILTTDSWVFRENRVPHYQREFQKHDGLRTWEKVRSLRIQEPGQGER